MCVLLLFLSLPLLANANNVHFWYSCNFPPYLRYEVTWNMTSGGIQLDYFALETLAKFDEDLMISSGVTPMESSQKWTPPDTIRRRIPIEGIAEEDYVGQFYLTRSFNATGGILIPRIETNCFPARFVLDRCRFLECGVFDRTLLCVCPMSMSCPMRCDPVSSSTLPTPSPVSSNTPITSISSAQSTTPSTTSTTSPSVEYPNANSGLKNLTKIYITPGNVRNVLNKSLEYSRQGDDLNSDDVNALSVILSAASKLTNIQPTVSCVSAALFEIFN
ncbi:hypothetical protein L596_029043 [Steinernema carpocapsae]|uniref:DOMON domain-containing protein n=1 Tax=Steinernema carpocapsae TaxID=34508 RepID=A0A4U5LTG6_STECR|nr:hypothetical protein L596_029043 [Steinernema carpocapsae]